MKRPLVQLVLAAAAAALFSTSFVSASDRTWANSPLKPVHAPMPIFPERMLVRGIHTGTVQLMLEVNPGGQVKDVLITAYTHRDFASVTEDAVETWSFAAGEVGHVVQLTLEFQTRGIIAYVRNFDPEAEAPARFVFRPCPPNRLDARPRPVETVQPLYAPSLAAEGTAGVVTLDYFIDQAGRVRMPVIAHTPDPLLAGLAIDALRQWKFEPPTCDGQPALVRARQSFRFGEPAG